MANLDDETAHLAHSEDVESGHHPKDIQQRRESVKHGDRALALLGDERVELTEEDVSQRAFFHESPLGTKKLTSITE